VVGTGVLTSDIWPHYFTVVMSFHRLRDIAFSDVQRYKPVTL